MPRATAADAEAVRWKLEADLAAKQFECDSKGRVLEQFQVNNKELAARARGSEEKVQLLTRQADEQHSALKKALARVEGDQGVLAPLEGLLRLSPLPNEDPEKAQFLAVRVPLLEKVMRRVLDSATEVEFNQSVYFAKGFL